MFCRASGQAGGLSEPVTAQTVLVIDAGHGGGDGGPCPRLAYRKAISIWPLRKNTAAACLCRPGDHHDPGREGPYTLGCADPAGEKVSDLSSRVKLVNETAGSILLSIHQNSLPGSKVRGAQVFYNAVEPAQQMAVSVQQALNSAVNHGSGKNAKQMDDSIYLMKNICSPGILVECGFLSALQKRSFCKRTITSGAFPPLSCPDIYRAERRSDHEGENYILLHRVRK